MSHPGSLKKQLYLFCFVCIVVVIDKNYKHETAVAKVTPF